MFGIDVRALRRRIDKKIAIVASSRRIIENEDLIHEFPAGTLERRIALVVIDNQQFDAARHFLAQSFRLVFRIVEHANFEFGRSECRHRRNCLVADGKTDAPAEFRKRFGQRQAPHNVARSNARRCIATK